MGCASLLSVTQPGHAKSDTVEAPLSEEERADLLKRTEAEIEKIKAEQAAELAKPPKDAYYTQQAHLYGFLLIFGNIPLYWVALNLSLEFNTALLGVTGYKPGDDPPFYFLQQEMVEGLTLIIPFILAFSLAGAFFRRSPIYAIIAATQAILFFLPPVAVALLIACNTSYLYDPVRATSAWATQADYLADPWFWGVQGMVMALGFMVAFAPHVLKYYKVIDFKPR